MSQKDPLTVACPICSAAVGKPCTRYGNFSVQHERAPHVARKWLAAGRPLPATVTVNTHKATGDFR